MVKANDSPFSAKQMHELLHRDDQWREAGFGGIHAQVQEFLNRLRMPSISALCPSIQKAIDILGPFFLTPEVMNITFGYKFRKHQFQKIEDVLTKPHEYWEGFDSAEQFWRWFEKRRDDLIMVTTVPYTIMDLHRIMEARLQPERETDPGGFFCTIGLAPLGKPQWYFQLPFATQFKPYIGLEILERQQREDAYLKLVANHGQFMDDSCEQYPSANVVVQVNLAIDEVMTRLWQGDKEVPKHPFKLTSVATSDRDSEDIVAVNWTEAGVMIEKHTPANSFQTRLVPARRKKKWKR